VANPALKILRDKQGPLKERQAKLRAIANANFDFTWMSRLALGYHWRKITPQQRKDFTQVFTAFIQDSYLSKMQDFSVNKVDFVRERQTDPGYAQVFSNVVQPGKQPVPVNYMLAQKDGRWLIYDVTVDNISIIANYRNQFNRVVNRNGFGALMTDLRNKHDQLAAELGTRHGQN
jgi:phospholipid transport system substrate-binding protein